MSVSVFTVFAAAFFAATVIPVASEVVLAAALADESLARWTLWIAATAGNTLGAVLNWGLGRFGTLYREQSWFPASPSQMERAEEWFWRYGVWTLLLAWLPVVGDALTVIAGLLRVRLSVFLILVGIGKGSRYAAVIAGVDALLF
jgi:membrane protein YqaA with SNARE-associated domain